MSAPPRARVATVEPQRIHSALMPGISGSTRCVNPHASQESTFSAAAIAPRLAICVPGKIGLSPLEGPAMKRIAILLSTLALLFLTGCGYNQMQSGDEHVKAAWAEVVNQYQRRADLIPNLVNTVQGFAQQEQQVHHFR